MTMYAWVSLKPCSNTLATYGLSMLEAAKYSCTKRDSRSESPLPSALSTLSTTCVLSGRSHRQTLAVAPLPSDLMGVKPVMPADLSTASASARRLASTRATVVA